ncbi:unnamed protein product [Umbelopsis ramanniana]
MGSHIPSIEQDAPEKQPRQTMPVNFFGPSVYSKFYKAFICVVVLASPMLASAQQSSINPTSCVTGFNNATDYFPVKVQADDATLFKIEYHNSYKLLTSIDPYGIANETYALYQCGTTIPTGLANGTKIIQIPVSRVGVLDVSVIPYLEMLGVANTVTAVGDDIFVSSACFQKQVAGGNIVSLSSTNATLADQQLSGVDIELGAYAADSTNNKSIAVYASQDPGTLNRAEWLEFFAAFFNKEQAANTLTGQINDNYNRLKQAASGYNPKPVVAWANYQAPSQYNNNTASWGISNATYKVELTKDAGGTALGLGSYSNVTAFQQAIVNVDVLIDETYYATSLSDVLTNYNISSADQSKYKFLANKALYREDGISTTAGGQDWLESAISMADAVLEDVIDAINPSTNFTRRWLRNVAANETIRYSSAANCTGNENDARADSATNFTTTTTFAQPTYGSSASTSSPTSGAAASLTFVFSTVMATAVASVFALML